MRLFRRLAALRRPGALPKFSALGNFSVRLSNVQRWANPRSTDSFECWGRLVQFDQHSAGVWRSDQEEINARAARSGARRRVYRVQPESLAKNLSGAIHILAPKFNLLNPLA